MNLFTADVGNGKVHIYDSNRDIAHLKLPQQRLINLDIDGLESGDVIVIEDAHLRERVKDGLSLAHTFYIGELEQLYRNAEKRQIKILLFPQKKTPVVRKLVGYNPEHRKSNSVFMKVYGLSTDEADIRSIAQFLKRDKEAFKRLKKFKPITQKEHQEQNAHKFNFVKECNQDLNIARTQGYGFDDYYDYGDDDTVTQFIKNQKYELSSRLVGQGIFDLDADSTFDGEELMDAVGLHYSKSKKGELNAVQSVSRLYTLVASILRPNGELRKREFPPGHKYEGKKLPVTWKWSKENYFGCKSFHERQGVAASNYKQHMRPGISNFEGKSLSIGADDEEYNFFKTERSIADKKTQEIWYVLREMIVEDGLR
jgi:hypothetical protein|tara:strand:+ start:188 stop:1294 length:1107 start_codon:yes stop_codon:yes gene_type:complete